MNRQTRPKRPNEGQAREKYNVLYQRFIDGQFNYSSHILLKRICESGQKQPYLYGVPIYKIMLEVVKIMMMNELQILFLGSTLQEMKWRVTDPCLYQYVQEVSDVTPRVQKDLEGKKVQLSLLLIAYIVKIYLNEDNSIFDFKIRDIIKNNFERMYQAWVQKVQNNFKFNPKNMNRLFKEFDNNKKDKQIQVVDYNKLVSEFFKQNDGDIQPEREIEQDHQYHNYQSSTNKNNNNFDDLPLEEQIERVPSESYRRTSRLNRQVSGLDFTRRISGNQFLAPEGRRQNMLQFIKNASIDQRQS